MTTFDNFQHIRFHFKIPKVGILMEAPEARFLMEHGAVCVKFHISKRSKSDFRRRPSFFSPRARHLEIFKRASLHDGQSWTKFPSLEMLGFLTADFWPHTGPMNQLNKNPNIAKLGDFVRL